MEYLTRNLNIQDGDEYVSASRINTYIGCPRKYYFNYVMKAEKESFPAAMTFGSAAHAVIEHVYKKIKAGAGPTGEKELKDVSSRQFDFHLERAYNESDKIVYPNKAGQHNAGEMKDKLINTMVAWMDHCEMPTKVFGVETRFRSQITDPKTGEVKAKHLFGVVDAITQRNGETILEEHKTSARKWTDMDWDYALQSTLYLAAHPEIDKMQFNILIKTKVPSFQKGVTSRTTHEKKDAVDTLCRVMDAIDAEIFYPINSWRCTGCQFYRQCRSGKASA